MGSHSLSPNSSSSQWRQASVDSHFLSSKPLKEGLALLSDWTFFLIDQSTISSGSGQSVSLSDMEAPIYATGIAAKLRSQWDRDDGLGQNHKAVKFLGQDYESLKANCAQRRGLFEDPLFPCAPSSLGFDELGPRSAKTSGVRWMRPTVRRGRGCMRWGRGWMWWGRGLM